MGLDPGKQGLQALISLACGPGLGLVYDLTAALRRRLRLDKLRLPLDLLFCLLAALVLFLLGIVAGEGRLRLFMPLFLALGAVLYLLALRPWGQACAEFLASLLLRICSILLSPLVLLGKIAKKFLNFAKKLFQYLAGWFTINYQTFVSVKCVCLRRVRHEAKAIRYTDEAGGPGSAGVYPGLLRQDAAPHRRGRGNKDQSAGGGTHPRRGQRRAGV